VGAQNRLKIVPTKSKPKSGGTGLAKERRQAPLRKKRLSLLAKERTPVNNPLDLGKKNPAAAQETSQGKSCVKDLRATKKPKP